MITGIVLAILFAGIVLVQFIEGEVIVTTPKGKQRFTFKGIFARTEEPF